MNKSLAHLGPQQRRELEVVKRIILQAAGPEKIILFGVFSNAAEARNYTERVPPSVPAYDLLVVMREGACRSDYELQDLIEDRCRGSARVTALVYDIGHVNRRIREGQVFFASVAQDGILLFDAGRSPLAKPGLADPVQVSLLAESDFDRWSRQSIAFYRSAVFNLDAGEWKTALFLLHQALEQIYQAILLVYMGYKPTTHNLDKLRRHTNRYSPELSLVFPRSPGEEDRLFRLLLSGYVDARYKDGFNIGEPDARLLTERVGRLLEVAERVCRDRLAVLARQAGG